MKRLILFVVLTLLSLNAICQTDSIKSGTTEVRTDDLKLLLEELEICDAKSDYIDSLEKAKAISDSLHMIEQIRRFNLESEIENIEKQVSQKDIQHESLNNQLNIQVEKNKTLTRRVWVAGGTASAVGVAVGLLVGLLVGNK